MKNKQNEMDGELVGEPLVYEPPMCICLGTIRDMTKGGPPGTGDSGNFQFEQVS